MKKENNYMTFETIVTEESEESISVLSTMSVFQFAKDHYRDRTQHQTLLLTVGDKNDHLKNAYLVHVGEVNENTLNIRNICRKIIEDDAKKIIICYIRPSSSDTLMPRKIDIFNAKKIVKASSLLDTKVLYQLIIGNTGFTELKEDASDIGDILS
jgi:DNA repair protein RadC